VFGLLSPFQGAFTIHIKSDTGMDLTCKSVFYVFFKDMLAQSSNNILAFFTPTFTFKTSNNLVYLLYTWVLRI
jgi:hypothetical protein